MFEKTLPDIVKGIRSHKKDPDAYLQRVLGEIREEVKSADQKIKAQAVEKLVYVRGRRAGRRQSSTTRTLLALAPSRRGVPLDGAIRATPPVVARFRSRRGPVRRVPGSHSSKCSVGP